MAYNAVGQHDYDSDHDSTGSQARHPLQSLASPVFAPPLTAEHGLFLDDDRNTSSSHGQQNKNTDTSTSPRTSGGSRLAHLVQSIATTASTSSRTANTSGSYEMVEDDDYEADTRSSPLSQPYSSIDRHEGGTSASPREASPAPLHIPRPRDRRRPSQATVGDPAPSPAARDHVVRTASTRGADLRHPAPDLQTLQGAYTSNIEQLEKTAEQLSSTGSMDDAIKDLHDEQKRSDSRRSSLLSNQGMSVISPQLSNASSIVEVNSAARSGGYSPAGFIMSPKGSFTAGAGRNRSGSNLSKASRFGSRPEPEMEGRPLDSFVALPSLPPMSPTASIAEQDEGSATLTRPMLDDLPESHADDRPPTSASSTYDPQFADFDGVHNDHTERPEYEQRRLSGNDPVNLPHRSISFGDDLNNQEHAQRRISSGNRLSMARPQSYADPDSGQQMVFYPAPVPAMLNLPQKLSKNTSSTTRNKRRSQVMSSIPQAARQSAIWLPDVLEDEPDFGEEAGVQEQEYLPQHQRATMGGRRSTQDLAHLPPQLRASAFFDLPAPEQQVEMKEQSAVATLDSILDASAHAPVSAFTDHAYAGHLGSEVYGAPKPSKRQSRSSTQLLEPPTTMPKKRTSSFNLLRRRTASGSDLLESDQEKKRASTLSGALNGGIRTVIDEDEDENKETTPLAESAKDPESRAVSGDFGLKGQDLEEESSSDDGQRDDEVYHGAPTTLLAELQLRKQQQKQRTKPLASAYPNGMHSTLLQLDAVAQVEQRSRKQKKITLAWEDPATQEPEEQDEDDDVPLAILYSKKAAEANRPLGLMERREMEDNEPLSRRRDRLQGRPPQVRAHTMLDRVPTLEDPEEEGETLAQRIRRLKEQGGTVTDLPAARPVSGDFASEMLSQFGGDALDTKDKGKEKAAAAVPPEEETLGQRRKRLQAEREAREAEINQRPALTTRRSMADILQAHPQAGAGAGSRNASYEKPLGGLVGMHEKTQSQRPKLETRRSTTMLNLEGHLGSQQQASSGVGLMGAHDKQRMQRSSTMLDLSVQSRALSGGFKSGMYNDGQGGIVPQAQPLQPQQPNYANAYVGGFPQPGFGGYPTQPNMLAYQNPYIYNPNTMGMGMNMNMYNPMMMPGSAMGMGMGVGGQPQSQGQLDMVERWRQSVMQ